MRVLRGRHVAHCSARGFASIRPSRGRDSPQVLYEDIKQKFGYMGVVNHREVGVLDLYRILRGVINKRDYTTALQTLNLFYNFGVKLKHRELSTRLLAAAMVAKQESEAVELVKLYGTWLEFPPDSSVVYAVMSHFLDKGEVLVVRELAKAVREDWRMTLEAPLYSLAIEGVLQLPADQDPLGEALVLLEDAGRVGVRLPPPLRTRLLDSCLLAWEGTRADGEEAVEVAEESAEAFKHLRTAITVADGLAVDGYLRGGASAALHCSVAWLFWHLSALPDATRSALLEGAAAWGAVSHLGASWSKTLEAGCDHFGSRVGFSPQLPRGFFRCLEASSDQEAARLVQVSKLRFGRFYPSEE